METEPHKGVLSLTERDRELLNMRRDLDRLKMEVRSTSIRPPHRGSAQERARSELEDMMRLGASMLEIQDRMRDEYGAPRSWVRDEVLKIMERQQASLPLIDQSDLLLAEAKTEKKSAQKSKAPGKKANAVKTRQSKAGRKKAAGRK